MSLLWNYRLRFYISTTLHDIYNTKITMEHTSPIRVNIALNTGIIITAVRKNPYFCKKYFSFLGLRLNSHRNEDTVSRQANLNPHKHIKSGRTNPFQDKIKLCFTTKMKNEESSRLQINNQAKEPTNQKNPYYLQMTSPLKLK